MRSKAVCFLLALGLLPSPGIAQETSFKPAPRIALVLEGGGALGLAHIGVIRWLEENHIPVHYVAGTSMGALVGGLYAAGNNPTELNQIVVESTGTRCSSDQIPFQDLSYRRKEDARDYPNTLQFGLEHGLRLPSGFNAGYQVSLILDRYMLPYSDIKSFDQLPIPFRCVAVDLVSKQKYVFSDGPVSQAMRASMSLPGFFSPVVDKKHIFVDGGLLDNLPVDVGREMGGELILAVHLQTKPTTADRNISSIGVLSDSIDVVIAANELQSMQKADLLVTVDVSDFTSTDYYAAQKLIAKGYEAAQQKANLLRAFSVDDVTWNRYITERNSRRRETIPTPEFVAVQGATPAASKVIQTDLSKLAGQPLDIDKLENGLTQIVGTGRFSKLNLRSDRTARTARTPHHCRPEGSSHPRESADRNRRIANRERPLRSAPALLSSALALTKRNGAPTSPSAPSMALPPTTSAPSKGSRAGSSIPAPSPTLLPSTFTTRTVKSRRIVYRKSPATSTPDISSAAAASCASATSWAICD